MRQFVLTLALSYVGQIICICREKNDTSEIDMVSEKYIPCLTIDIFGDEYICIILTKCLYVAIQLARILNSFIEQLAITVFLSCFLLFCSCFIP